MRPDTPAPPRPASPGVEPTPGKAAAAPGAFAVHLSCANRSGSVEHYYHFYFGFLVPLVLACERLQPRAEVAAIYVRSCAIMDEHLPRLGYSKLRVLPRSAHEALGETDTDAQGLPLKHLRVPGYDGPNAYRFGAIQTATAVLLERLGPAIAQEATTLPIAADGSLKILMFNRQAPQAFYLSAEAEIPGAGTDRRSLPNFPELLQRVRETYPATIEMYPEDHSLAAQAAALRWADVVIGQHGAALGNMVLCDGPTALVEICPHDIADDSGPGKRHFLRLSRLYRMPYVHVAQEHSHAPVAPETILQAIDSLPRPSALRRLVWRAINRGRQLAWQLRYRPPSPSSSSVTG
ncbi:glycosyltransferase 61 family protein [Mangrovimicrobium sediminis]|uniref:glycosyltransferase 61 family protein n=1 Tax=Mangrovimicrobium sediminis TaxID=2562682 RepID=UPI0014367271|nr:glycosyltransferase 61 family protein [Haliea sp. SAOS-164]